MDFDIKKEIQKQLQLLLDSDTNSKEFADARTRFELLLKADYLLSPLTMRTATEA